MEWLIWIVIIFLIILILVMGGFTLRLRSNFEDCNNNTSVYCPEYVCSDGSQALTYSDCVNKGQCADGLIPPCSISGSS